MFILSLTHICYINNFLQLSAGLINSFLLKVEIPDLPAPNTTVYGLFIHFYLCKSYTHKSLGCVLSAKITCWKKKESKRKPLQLYANRLWGVLPASPSYFLPYSLCSLQLLPFSFLDWLRLLILPWFNLEFRSQLPVSSLTQQSQRMARYKWFRLQVPQICGVLPHPTLTSSSSALNSIWKVD